MKYIFNTQIQKFLCDTLTPVQMYYQIRDQFPNSLLLESSDYKSKENSYSYICFNPIASFIVQNDSIKMRFPNQLEKTVAVKNFNVAQELNHFIEAFEHQKSKYDFITNGLFGYTAYDAIPLFENINFKTQDKEIPLVHYQLFQNILVFDHFYNNLYFIHHGMDNEDEDGQAIWNCISNRAISTFHFETLGKEQSNFKDSQFLEVINKGINHCHLGDVFQIVLSRQFTQAFKGDDLNVYRALRSVNPSPYLFYFDYGNFKIFGSSPEAQLKIHKQQASINTIAGTYRRTGVLEEDQKLGEQLAEDPKESAEHIMLVDLARNDLSKYSTDVSVHKFKSIEYYSHVIHLVSQVKATLEKDYNPIEILGNTYPAGTLSGAPKYKAMTLIDEYEPTNRVLYGGTLGVIGLDKTINHAIIIRSFMSKDNVLSYQAGCGVVAKSNPKSELEEVNNKLSALKKAIELAREI